MGVVTVTTMPEMMGEQKVPESCEQGHRCRETKCQMGGYCRARGSQGNTQRNCHSSHQISAVVHRFVLFIFFKVVHGGSNESEKGRRFIYIFD
jgi:hypothetical protein